MKEKLLENWLDSSSERSYQAVFVQLLSARGYRVVHSTRHSALEFGKDVIAIDPDGKGCAFQLKSHPKGRIGLGQFRNEIQGQLIQLMSQAIVFPGFPQAPYKVYLVSNGYFDEEVQRAVDDLNRMPYYSSHVSLISRGDLHNWITQFDDSWWPSELDDSLLLLELFLADPKDLMPSVKLSKLINRILLLESIEESLQGKPAFYRAVTSAALLTGIAISRFAESDNFLAVISAWTVFSLSIIASADKHDFKIDGMALESLLLAESAIINALCQLWEEVLKRDFLIEGDGLSDPEVYGWRMTTLLGLFSCLAWVDQSVPCLTDESRAKLNEWLLQPSERIYLWGEGVIGCIAPWIIWLLKNEPTIKSNLRLVDIVKTIILFNQHNSDMPLANPYYSYEQIMRSIMPLNLSEKNWPINLKSFAGSSFSAEPLFHLLVRLNLKMTCKDIWPVFTKLTHRICIPEYPWEYCTLRIKYGKEQAKIYPSTYKWDDLKHDALEHLYYDIPQELSIRPHLLGLWWQIAPYRYSADSNRIFCEKFYPGWFSQK